jgi:charged multivesicular body protein 2A
MGALFGKEVPLKEILRENKRMITRAVRELDRERAGLQREEQRITMEIKKMAKEQQMGAVKILARDLVRTRTHVAKFIEMRSQLQSCALKLQTVKSHEAMSSAMKATTKAMMKMNKAVNTPSMSKMMAEFERENLKSEMMQEIMGEMMDEVFEEPGDEEESNKIVSQVLDEIGVSFEEEIPVGPTGVVNTVANVSILIRLIHWMHIKFVLSCILCKYLTVSSLTCHFLVFDL